MNQFIFFGKISHVTKHGVDQAIHQEKTVSVKTERDRKYYFRYTR